MQRNVYLEMVSVEEALEAAMAVLDRDRLVLPEMVPAHEAAGRMTAAPVFARYSSPTFHSAAMDGFAVQSAATFAAREGRPVRLAKGAQAVAVNTGHPLPPDMDAVVMIEHVLAEDADSVSLEKPAFPWQHVRRIGEDLVATELVLPQNHRITPYDVGALLSAGIWDVRCWERVRLAVIPTGDEVLDFTGRPEPGPGQVVESNSMVLCSLASSWGCQARRVPPVPDDPEALAAAVDAALNSDAHVVVVGAGSSAGSKDYTRSTFETFGPVLVHGLTVMPGKPTLIGAARGKLLVGAPGYPVSAVVCAEEILSPVCAWLGRTARPERREVEAVLTRAAPSRPGMTELVRLAMGRVGDRNVATPLARGAGLISTLTKAQAVAAIPAASEGVPAGGPVRARLLVPEEELSRTLVVVGSHDNTLDLLANELMGLDRPIRLASTHVGSMGGFAALRDGLAPMAGAHLFDPETGDFNFPFIAKHLPGRALTVVNLAIRHQGLMVAPGNPKGIRGVADLTREDVSFVNRQRGAGTRILLDWSLGQAGIAPDAVRGYAKEEFTHMAVAVNVLTGAADAGLGIFAAAKALGLDFVPLARERYDLLVAADLADHRTEAVLDLLRDPALQAKISALGGYETRLTGQVMVPGLGLGA
ncbi:MAG: molybdopterin biosynthesis protein [Thermodesulfobacteriota bacterium]